MCGEHPYCGMNFCLTEGSSPRVRGTLGDVGHFVLGQGIIPACAGNTCRPAGRMPCSWDHPRVCGEHLAASAKPQPWSGSSPRVRGTRAVVVGRVVENGIIPACAGNTAASSATEAKGSDHPRVCGEHFVAEVVGECFQGSSPRVRGTLLSGAEHDAAPGIIPACAGNTRPRRARRALRRDHPRVCGEHSGTLAFIGSLAGSSPRVRGTLWAR